MPSRMCIFRGLTGLNKTLFFVFVMMAMAFGLEVRADACSCAWERPFLTVAKKAPLVADGMVAGSIDGKQGYKKQIQLSDLRNRLLYPAFKETWLPGDSLDGVCGSGRRGVLTVTMNMPHRGGRG